MAISFAQCHLSDRREEEGEFPEHSQEPGKAARMRPFSHIALSLTVRLTIFKEYLKLLNGPGNEYPNVNLN